MPKVKGQRILFSLLMSFMMVYAMEVYNSSIIHKGLTNKLFLLPINELIVLMIIVIVLQTLVGGPLVQMLARKIVNPEKDKPIAVTLTVQVMTVCVMCPIMSFVATIIFKGGFNTEIFAIWVQTVAINFPMALFWQLFVAGPLVRLIIRMIFKEPRYKV